MLEQARKNLGKRFKENESLANHTTLRIGGPARFLALAKDAEEIKQLIAEAQAESIDYAVLGGGSNILASDDGFDGLVIKINGGEIKINGDQLIVDAGASLALTLAQSLKAGLIGLEWAMGIPGTIGGAVCGNAGAYGGEMSQNVSSVKILKQNAVIELPSSACDFGYRKSRFKKDGNKDIILSVALKLKIGTPEEIAAAKEKIAKITAERGVKFSEGPSAGSFFRNIALTSAETAELKSRQPEIPEQFIAWQKIPAAWLIDECGLRGRQIGGAKVSDRHAGIIINAGGATASDVLMLASAIKQKVRSKFSLQLMEEVQYLGF
ncbi:MAG: UDP-N-acetylmuramate dehydrogenase [Patescibacteria group bacterium]|jgi:UDP-N-acetylmuramate dehydrogenase